LAGLQGKKINIPKWRGDRTVFPPFCQCYLLAITSDFAKAIVGRHNFAMVPSYLSSEFAQVEETMKVAANAVIEDGITVARCDMCGSRFYRSRADNRFCSISCNRQFQITERRAALEFFRARMSLQREEANEPEEDQRQRASA
jgi:hypothetical protein